MEKKGDIKGLIKALGLEDPSIRKRAAEALGRTGDTRAIEPLIQILCDIHDRSFVRMAALMALVRGKEIPVFETQAKHAIVKIGKHTVELLIEALNANRQDSIGWERIAEVLGGIGDARAAKPLAEALKDEEWRVRSMAAYSLKKIGWTPSNDEEKAYYLIGRNDWDELVKLGETAVQPLLAILKMEDSNRARSRAATEIRKVLYRIKGSS
ncbi:HEAT repeat domain-containing protein, partial [Candidatus Bathyarchaeota archaeon]|nr:HEAT repeat domain-containing protein [Candidatus Bathyarchaeota archaeon]